MANGFTAEPERPSRDDPTDLMNETETDKLLAKWAAERTQPKETKMPANNAQREQLVSAGEHIHAVLKLGSSYTAETYLRAIDEACELGKGQAYADAVLGPDLEAILSGTEDDDETMKLAAADLRARNIDPASASYDQLRDSLIRVTS
jgi:hypothetical protein